PRGTVLGPAVQQQGEIVTVPERAHEEAGVAAGDVPLTPHGVLLGSVAPASVRPRTGPRLQPRRPSVASGPIEPPVSQHPVFALADAFVDAFAAVRPLEATFVGVHGHDHRWGDLGPDGLAAEADLLRDTRARLAALPPADDPW